VIQYPSTLDFSSLFFLSLSSSSASLKRGLGEAGRLGSGNERDGGEVEAAAAAVNGDAVGAGGRGGGRT
jgi:hypothetical protein